MRTFRKRQIPSTTVPSEPPRYGPEVGTSKRPPSYSQVDITERFDDHLRLGPEDWIDTIPLNRALQKSLSDPQKWGLPALGAPEDDVYEIASGLSALRERLPLSDDGVYCPICHTANTQLKRLRTPCPRCGRPLLQFGWN